MLQIKKIMLNQHLAQTIVISSMFLLANCLAFMFSGIGQALTAKGLGDSTAEEEGFLTLNPFVHIDIIGMTLLLLCGFGWINRVPVNPHNINAPWRPLKLVLLYGAETACAFILAVITSLLFIRMFAAESLLPGLAIFFSGVGFFNQFAAFYPTYSSWMIVVALFVLAFIFANIFVAAFSFIVNSFRLVTALTISEDSYYLYQHQPLMALLPFLGILFYFGKVRAIILYGMLLTINLIFSLLGA